MPTSANSLPRRLSGHVNPDWAEWLMGWPVGWTESRQLEPVRFREFLRSHFGVY